MGIDQLAHHAIPLGFFGRPRSHLRVRDLDARHVPGERVGLHVIVGHVRDDGTANGATVETAQRGAHAPSLRERRGAGGIQNADPHVQGQRRASGLVIPVGVSVHTFDVHDGPRLEEHLAMQAGHPPLILVLDVRLRAVTDHHDGDGVGAGVQMIGDVVFARESTVRSVPDERTVDEDRVHALGAADVQHGASPLPRSRNGDGASVHTGGVLLGHRRRTQGPRHLHVGVVREIADVLQRPVARHAHSSPTTRRFLGHGGRGDGVGVGEQSEVPLTREVRVPRRPRPVVHQLVGIGKGRQRLTHGKATDGHHAGVGPRSKGGESRDHPVSVSRRRGRRMHPDGHADGSDAVLPDHVHGRGRHTHATV